MYNHLKALVLLKWLWNFHEVCEGGSRRHQDFGRSMWRGLLLPACAKTAEDRPKVSRLVCPGLGTFGVIGLKGSGDERVLFLWCAWALRTGWLSPLFCSSWNMQAHAARVLIPAPPCRECGAQAPCLVVKIKHQVGWQVGGRRRDRGC